MAKSKKFKIGQTSYSIKKIGNRLDTITKRVENPTPELNRIGKAMVKKVDSSFRQQKDLTTSSKWEKLDKKTRPKRKKNTAKNSKMLSDTGRLKASLKQYKVSNKGKGDVHKVTLESDVPYARIQNHSTFDGKIKSPRRFASHSKEDVKKYKEGLIKYISKK